MSWLRYIVLSGILLILPITVYSQYFGKNKPFYRTFDFQLVETPHFQIYHYFEDDSVVNQLAAMTERWYRFHQQIFLDTFITRSPIIFYDNHADFQQTTAIMSHIGVGVGGVTEGLKNRVVMPMGFTWQQTNHVLGHELVHAFQFNNLTSGNGTGLSSIQNIPLWMIEGMAEYLSIGSVDAQTAIWMRDALMRNSFPTLEQMTASPRYSPYRFGQAFWAYVSYKYGEQYILRLFRATARQGYRQALRDVLFVTPEDFSADWERTLRNHLLENVNDSTYNIIGNRLITRQNAGRYNLSPSVSPDGKYIIFLSEKDIYGLDLFLADAVTGDIIKKVFSSTRHSEIDALNFLETAGTWSPDNRHIAFVAYSKGRSVLVIYDVERLRVIREISPECVSAISYPAWSPDGSSIVFSGQTGLQSDLFLLNLESGSCRNLTSNNWAGIQPAWAPDGKTIWFSTDEPSRWQTSRTGGFYNIAELSIETGETFVHFTFDGARNLNPVPVPDGRHVVFLSNRDGRRNLYAFEIETGFLRQITDYPTGITGMTELSPAMGFGGNSLYYNLLWGGEFQIIKTTFDNLWSLSRPISDRQKDNHAARLVPYSANLSLVEQNLLNMSPSYKPPVEVAQSRLRRQFQLDYIGNMGVGVATGRFGTGMAGSVEALFSDMLGRNLLYTAVSINGRIHDFGGQLAYMNQSRRLRLGGSFSHIPFRTGYYTYENGDPDLNDRGELVFYNRRIFEDKLAAFSNWPLNRYRRIEAGVAYAFYTYRTERISSPSFYYPAYSAAGERVESPPSFGVGTFDLAFVSDNSRFGITSPVDGHRFRVQAEQYFNDMNYRGFLFDYRKYWFVRPNSFALRVYHYGRYGQDADDNRFYRLFLGYPWLIRGYNTSASYSSETVEGQSISFNQLAGSRLLLGNFEWRLPFSGPMDFAMVRSGLFVSEMALFMDGGISWDETSAPVFSLTSNSDENRIPVMSTGVTFRFNIFGVMVLETYYAVPFFQQRFHRGEIGFNLMPGF
ncbi:basic secretory protein-like protein [Natronoflexus pectinivorans]|uniref:WD40 repeat protein n=1 Tax=Natronoflexus pectinivorans TaxID=682526 RepID=A0A4R2GR66_9BACT|nr:basic secretory protein-like protein [Natronoflexus pectinivorans]TCO10616.1 WD40 repeat protein [Natronoflexus pectinivorans]